MRLLARSAWILLLAFACIHGCARTAPPASSATESSTDRNRAADIETKAPLLIDEPSVRPGINDPYFQPNSLNRYSRLLEAETREIVQRRVDILEAIGLQKGMTVADIGAGTGLLTFDIADRVGNRGAVFAVDIVPAFIEMIQQRAKEEGRTNVFVIQGEPKATALAPASVDLAFMCDTYHHIEYPRAFMRSVFSSLRPGAKLVLVDLERIEGKTSPRLLRHIRAGKATVIKEVEEAGFVLESDTNLLEENYYLRFRRP